MAVKLGDTFLDKTDNPHLWIVAAGPSEDNCVILVNLTSMKGRDDRTTICQIGDHPFISRTSCIAYKYAVLTEVSSIELALAEGKFSPRDDCSPQFLKKVAGGLLESLSTPNRIQNAYALMLRKISDGE